MSIVFLKETTKTWNCEAKVPNHIYLIEGENMVGYIKDGTTDIKMFTKPAYFYKARRTFATLTKDTVDRLVYDK